MVSRSSCATLVSNCGDGARAAGVNGRAQQLGGGIHAILRASARTIGIIDAVVRIDPVVGRDLRCWKQSEISRLLATSCWVRPSWSARVRSTLKRSSGASTTWWICTSTAPGMRARRALDLARQRVIGRRVGQRPDHLHVDGRGQAEIQDLADDIGRLEEERQVGDTRGSGACAACGCNPRWRRAAGLQRDQDLAIERRRWWRYRSWRG